MHAALALLPLPPGTVTDHVALQKTAAPKTTTKKTTTTAKKPAAKSTTKKATTTKKTAAKPKANMTKTRKAPKAAPVSCHCRTDVYIQQN